MRDPKLRFSNRAQGYARYRPGYPSEVLTFLADRCGLARTSEVADVGSGSGILSEMFLRNGNTVFAAEPNREMREVAERLLGGHPRFESVAGSAEATTLESASADLVASGNAFHWFDAPSARAEFSRILKPGGRVAIFLNAPKKSGTPFLEAYGRLLSRQGADGPRTVGGYGSVGDPRAGVEAFFGDGGYETADLPDSQPLDLDGFKGLVFSYSNMPAEGAPGSGALLRDLETVFRANESDGRVVLEYVARVYCGGVASLPEE